VVMASEHGIWQEGMPGDGTRCVVRRADADPFIATAHVRVDDVLGWWIDRQSGGALMQRDDFEPYLRTDEWREL
jgi:hypothetical protein